MSQSAEAHWAQTPLRRTALRGTQWGQLDGPEGEPSGASSRVGRLRPNLNHSASAHRGFGRGVG